MSTVKNPILKRGLFILGWVSVAFAVIGVFLPLLPTTPFALFAAWCFFKSSPRAHRWILKQPVLGSSIVDWGHDRSISMKNKTIAIVTIALSLTFLWLKVDYLYLKIGVTSFLSIASLFILTRKTKS